MLGTWTVVIPLLVCLLTSTSSGVSSTICRSQGNIYGSQNWRLYRQCIHNRAGELVSVPKSCMKRQYFDTLEGRCLGIPGGGHVVFVDNSASCNSLGLIPHPTQARYYYICKSNKVIVALCNMPEIFNIERKHCERRHFASNDDDGHRFPRLPDCENVGEFASPDDCFAYYKCSSSGTQFIQTEYRCPQGTVYNATLQACDSKSFCRKNDSKCKAPGRFLVPLDCTMYTMCSPDGKGGFLQEYFFCPTDYIYHPLLEDCVRGTECIQQLHATEKFTTAMAQFRPKCGVFPDLKSVKDDGSNSKHLFPGQMNTVRNISSKSKFNEEILTKAPNKFDRPIIDMECREQIKQTEAKNEPLTTKVPIPQRKSEDEIKTKNSGCKNAVLHNEVETTTQDSFYLSELQTTITSRSKSEAFKSELSDLVTCNNESVSKKSPSKGSFEELVSETGRSQFVTPSIKYKYEIETDPHMKHVGCKSKNDSFQIYKQESSDDSHTGQQTRSTQSNYRHQEITLSKVTKRTKSDYTCLIVDSKSSNNSSLLIEPQTTKLTESNENEAFLILKSQITNSGHNNEVLSKQFNLSTTSDRSKYTPNSVSEIGFTGAESLRTPPSQNEKTLIAKKNSSDSVYSKEVQRSSNTNEEMLFTKKQELTAAISNLLLTTTDKLPKYDFCTQVYEDAQPFKTMKSELQYNISTSLILPKEFTKKYNNQMLHSMLTTESADNIKIMPTGCRENTDHGMQAFSTMKFNQSNMGSDTTNSEVARAATNSREELNFTTTTTTYPTECPSITKQDDFSKATMMPFNSNKCPRIDEHNFKVQLDPISVSKENLTKQLEMENKFKIPFHIETTSKASVTIRNDFTLQIAPVATRNNREETLSGVMFNTQYYPQSKPTLALNSGSEEILTQRPVLYDSVIQKHSHAQLASQPKSLSDFDFSNQTKPEKSHLQMKSESNLSAKSQLNTPYTEFSHVTHNIRDTTVSEGNSLSFLPEEPASVSHAAVASNDESNSFNARVRSELDRPKKNSSIIISLPELTSSAPAITSKEGNSLCLSSETPIAQESETEENHSRHVSLLPVLEDYDFQKSFDFKSVSAENASIDTVLKSQFHTHTLPGALVNGPQITETRPNDAFGMNVLPVSSSGNQLVTKENYFKISSEAMITKQKMIERNSLYNINNNNNNNNNNSKITKNLNLYPFTYRISLPSTTFSNRNDSFNVSSENGNAVLSTSYPNIDAKFTPKIFSDPTLTKNDLHFNMQQYTDSASYSASQTNSRIGVEGFHKSKNSTLLSDYTWKSSTSHSYLLNASTGTMGGANNSLNGFTTAFKYGDELRGSDNNQHSTENIFHSIKLHTQEDVYSSATKHYLETDIYTPSPSTGRSYLSNSVPHASPSKRNGITTTTTKDTSHPSEDDYYSREQHITVEYSTHSTPSTKQHKVDEKTHSHYRRYTESTEHHMGTSEATQFRSSPSSHDYFYSSKPERLLNKEPSLGTKSGDQFTQDKESTSDLVINNNTKLLGVAKRNYETEYSENETHHINTTKHFTSLDRDANTIKQICTICMASSANNLTTISMHYTVTTNNYISASILDQGHKAALKYFSDSSMSPLTTINEYDLPGSSIAASITNELDAELKNGFGKIKWDQGYSISSIGTGTDFQNHIDVEINTASPISTQGSFRTTQIYTGDDEKSTEINTASPISTQGSFRTTQISAGDDEKSTEINTASPISTQGSFRTTQIYAGDDEKSTEINTASPISTQGSFRTTQIYAGDDEKSTASQDFNDLTPSETNGFYGSTAKSIDMKTFPSIITRHYSSRGESTASSIFNDGTLLALTTIDHFSTGVTEHPTTAGSFTRSVEEIYNNHNKNNFNDQYIITTTTEEYSSLSIHETYMNNDKSFIHGNTVLSSSHERYNDSVSEKYLHIFSIPINITDNRYTNRRNNILSNVIQQSTSSMQSASATSNGHFMSRETPPSLMTESPDTINRNLENHKDQSVPQQLSSTNGEISTSNAASNLENMKNIGTESGVHKKSDSTATLLNTGNIGPWKYYKNDVKLRTENWEPLYEKAASEIQSTKFSSSHDTDNALQAKSTTENSIYNLTLFTEELEVETDEPLFIMNHSSHTLSRPKNGTGTQFTTSSSAGINRSLQDKLILSLTTRAAGIPSFYQPVQLNRPTSTIMVLSTHRPQDVRGASTFTKEATSDQMHKEKYSSVENISSTIAMPSCQSLLSHPISMDTTCETNQKEFEEHEMRAKPSTDNYYTDEEILASGNLKTSNIHITDSYKNSINGTNQNFISPLSRNTNIVDHMQIQKQSASTLKYADNLYEGILSNSLMPFSPTPTIGDHTEFDNLFTTYHSSSENNLRIELNPPRNELLTASTSEINQSTRHHSRIFVKILNNANSEQLLSSTPNILEYSDNKYLWNYEHLQTTPLPFGTTEPTYQIFKIPDAVIPMSPGNGTDSTEVSSNHSSLITEIPQTTANDIIKFGSLGNDRSHTHIQIPHSKILPRTNFMQERETSNYEVTDLPNSLFATKSILETELIAKVLSESTNHDLQLSTVSYGITEPVGNHTVDGADNTNRHHSTAGSFLQSNNFRNTENPTKSPEHNVTDTKGPISPLNRKLGTGNTKASSHGAMHSTEMGSPNYGILSTNMNEFNFPNHNIFDGTTSANVEFHKFNTTEIPSVLNYVSGIIHSKPTTNLPPYREMSHKSKVSGLTTEMPFLHNTFTSGVTKILNISNNIDVHSGVTNMFALFQTARADNPPESGSFKISKDNPEENSSSQIPNRIFFQTDSTVEVPAGLSLLQGENSSQKHKQASDESSILVTAANSVDEEEGGNLSQNKTNLLPMNVTLATTSTSSSVPERLPACEEIGSFRLANSCRHYYDCMYYGRGEIVQSGVKKCEGCLVFNSNNGICDFPDNVPECSPRKMPSNCTSEGSFAVPGTLDKYYLCIKTAAGDILRKTKECPRGHIYSSQRSRCMPRQAIDDYRRINNNVINCNGRGFFSHPHNCNKFVHCVGTESKSYLSEIKSCPPQMYFNEIGGYCDRPENILTLYV